MASVHASRTIGKYDLSARSVFLRLTAECLELLIAAQPALRDAFMLLLSAASALFDLHAVNS